VRRAARAQESARDPTLSTLQKKSEALDLVIESPIAVQAGALAAQTVQFFDPNKFSELDRSHPWFGKGILAIAARVSALR